MFDKKVVLIVSAAVIITAGLASGYYFYNKEINSDNNKLILQNNIMENLKNSIQKKESASIAKNNQNAQVIQDIQKTDENTKMIYEYYYKDDGIIKRKEESLPPELVNKTRETIENLFDGWNIITFNNSEIVLRKDIEGTSETGYLLKEYDGFIAVFYEQNQELKEMTSTPIKSLPEEEQILLKKGIFIKGNENLLKILQDYES